MARQFGDEDGQIPRNLRLFLVYTILFFGSELKSHHIGTCKAMKTFYLKYYALNKYQKSYTAGAKGQFRDIVLASRMEFTNSLGERKPDVEAATDASGQATPSPHPQPPLYGRAVSAVHPPPPTHTPTTRPHVYGMGGLGGGIPGVRDPCAHAAQRCERPQDRMRDLPRIAHRPLMPPNSRIRAGRRWGQRRAGVRDPHGGRRVAGSACSGSMNGACPTSLSAPSYRPTPTSEQGGSTGGGVRGAGSPWPAARGGGIADPGLPHITPRALMLLTSRIRAGQQCRRRSAGGQHPAAAHGGRRMRRRRGNGILPMPFLLEGCPAAHFIHRQHARWTIGRIWGAPDFSGDF
ncbi:hypothetical protein B0H14DRAFT_3163103 [Mycena olivaceomarginata]|nr:hypothetical protein B0H14DRAFT_3163103 [Mycena olivaceomarginata]